MSSSMFRCEICNSKMTGPETYKQHVEGKKHQRKLKALAEITPDSQAKPEDEAAQNKSDQIKDKDNGGLCVKSSSDDGTQSKNGNEEITDQVEEKDNGGECVKSSTENGSQSNQGNKEKTDDANPVKNAVKANPLKRPIFDERCGICDVEFTSKSHHDLHMSGKKHRKKMQTIEAIGSTDDATLYCGYCNLFVNSIEQMEQHMNGSYHNKKVEIAKTLQGVQPPHSAAKKKYEPSNELDTSDKLIMTFSPDPPEQLPDSEPLTPDPQVQSPDSEPLTSDPPTQSLETEPLTSDE